MLARRKLEAAMIARSEASLFDVSRLESLEEERIATEQQSYLQMVQEASDIESLDSEHPAGAEDPVATYWLCEFGFLQERMRCKHPGSAHSRIGKGDSNNESCN